MTHVTDAPLFVPLQQPDQRRRSFLSTLLLWHRRSSTRADLSRLDARSLHAVGLTRFEAEMECAKWFWQA